MYNGGPIEFSTQQCMNHFQVQPSWVKGPLNQQTEVERRYLYTKLFSKFKFTLPEQWPINFFRYFLFYFGSIAVIYTKELGWIIYPYGITKLNSYYQPAMIEVYNEFLRSSKTGVIGVNAEIIRLMDDYRGLDDLVVKYAEMLANLDKAFNINLMNSNVSLFAEAENEKDAIAIKQAYAKATTGEPMVALNKRIMDGKQLMTLIANPKSNFLGLEYQQTRQEIMREFLTDVGIPTANYNKRAQMSDDEINKSDDESKAIVTVIEETLKDCFARVNSISNLGIAVSLRGGRNGTNNPVGNVSVSK